MIYKTKSHVKKEKAIIAAYLRNHRARAKKQGIKYELTVKNIYPMFEALNYECKILPGHKIDLSKRAPHENAFAIILVDNNEGFNPRNIIICCHKARIIRGNAHFNNFRAVYLALTSHKDARLEAENRYVESLGRAGRILG